MSFRLTCLVVAALPVAGWSQVVRIKKSPALHLALSQAGVAALEKVAVPAASPAAREPGAPAPYQGLKGSFDAAPKAPAREDLLGFLPGRAVFPERGMDVVAAFLMGMEFDDPAVPGAKVFKIAPVANQDGRFDQFDRLADAEKEKLRGNFKRVAADFEPVTFGPTEATFSFKINILGGAETIKVALKKSATMLYMKLDRSAGGPVYGRFQLTRKP